jgi:Cu+-exporting ATPase
MSTDSIINIKDMTCVACENKIQNRLSQINGVEKVTVSFNTGIVCVRYDDKVISLVQINEAVVRLGYTLGKKQKRD